MKILILSDSWPPKSMGGADIVASNMAKYLEFLGNDVFVVTIIKDISKAGEFNLDGVRGVKIFSNYEKRWRAYKSLNNKKIVRQVKNIIEEFKPDVVHAHNIHIDLSYTCLKVAKKSGAKVFLTAHDVMMFSYGKLTSFKYLRPDIKEIRNNFDYKLNFWNRLRQAKGKFNPFREMIIKYYLKNVDLILTVSLALQEALRQNGIYNTKLLHNGIEVSGWQVSEDKINEFKERKGLTQKKIVLFGGRLSKAKGIEQIIEYMALVRKSLPEAVLAVFGGNIGLEDSGILSLGWVSGDDLKMAYAISDIVVVPSVCFDSLPTVILEAMASKKPVIATQFGGARELVVEGETGYIVNPFDVENVSKKISYLLLNKEKANLMGLNGYNRVASDFNLEKQTKKLIEFYKTN